MLQETKKKKKRKKPQTQYSPPDPDVLFSPEFT